jgi:hypothetical protein
VIAFYLNIRDSLSNQSLYNTGNIPVSIESSQYFQKEIEDDGVHLLAVFGRSQAVGGVFEDFQAMDSPSFFDGIGQNVSVGDRHFFVLISVKDKDRAFDSGNVGCRRGQAISLGNLIRCASERLLEI